MKSARKRSVLRNALSGGALAGIVMATGLATAGPAAADASGCTPADLGMVCGNVWGDSTYVHDAGIARDKIELSICDYQGVVTVYNSSGSKIWQKHSPRHGGCSVGRAWFDFPVNRYFPNNSKISLSWYERGVHQATVSHRITK